MVLILITLVGAIFSFLLARPTLLLSLTSLVVGYLTYRHYKKKSQRQKWNNIGKDIVLLHGFPQYRSHPCLGPFVVKLETYFKMAGIKYEMEKDEPMGPKGKCPWITFNGEDYTDSQLIMEFLSGYFKKDFSSKLTDEQKAIARSLQIMAEEHLYWGLVSWRYVEDDKLRLFEITSAFPTYLRYAFPLLRRWMKGSLHSQGTGRHSFSERRDIMIKDIEALSIYLAEKPYFMGTEATEVDCCLYGQLSQLVWNAPGSPYEKMIKEKYKNLEAFCVRMREKYGSEK